MNNLSVERFNRAEDAGHAKPKDALIAAIEELDEHKIVSVAIVCMSNDDEPVTYYAGPHVSTLKKVWRVFQNELYRVMERLIEGEG